MSSINNDVVYIFSIFNTLITVLVVHKIIINIMCVFFCLCVNKICDKIKQASYYFNNNIVPSASRAAISNFVCLFVVVKCPIVILDSSPFTFSISNKLHTVCT